MGHGGLDGNHAGWRLVVYRQVAPLQADQTLPQNSLVMPLNTA
jgi:hypothetical protein